MERIKVTPFNLGKGAEKHSFMVDAPYYKPNDEVVKDLIRGIKGMKAIVMFTEVKHDRGSRIEERFGTPRNVYYDNGLVGYQNYDLYKSVEEAKHALEMKKLVSNKYFVDIFMVSI